MVSCSHVHYTLFSRCFSVQAVNGGLRCPHDEQLAVGDLPGRCVCFAHDTHQFVSRARANMLPAIERCDPRMRVQIQHISHIDGRRLSATALFCFAAWRTKITVCLPNPPGRIPSGTRSKVEGPSTTKDPFMTWCGPQHTAAAAAGSAEVHIN